MPSVVFPYHRKCQLNNIVSFSCFLVLTSDETSTVLGRASIEKNVLSGHCPDRSDPPSPGRGNGQRGPFFRPSKTTFRRVLQNLILIENDYENDDDNGDNFDA